MKRIAKSTLAAAVVTVNVLFSTNSVAMALASSPYDADEYIEDYQESTEYVGK